MGYLRFLIVVPLALPLSLRGQQEGSTAVPFLMMAPDARAAGMGNVGAATAPDVHALHWNAARYAHAEQGFGLGLSVTPMLQQLTDRNFLTYLSGYYRFGRSAVAASVNYLSMGDYYLADGAGSGSSVYRPNEMAFALAYARRFSPHFSLSMTMRHINSSMSSLAYGEGNRYKRGVLAADLGAFFSYPTFMLGKDGKWSLGASVSNLGQRMDYGTGKLPLPGTLRLGASYDGYLDGHSKIRLAMDLVKPIHADLLSLRRMGVGTGAEWELYERIAFRAGYSFPHDRSVGHSYPTFGTGISFEGFIVDISYLVSNQTDRPLGYKYRYGIAYRWNKK